LFDTDRIPRNTNLRQDGGRRYVDLVVALEIEAHAHGSIPFFSKAAKPNVVLSSPDTEKAAGLADVVRDLLSVLEHAKPSLDLASLLLLVRVGASSRANGN
jgi:hypothetical protein